MNTNDRSFLTQVIKSWTTYTPAEIDDMSDFEVATIGTHLMLAAQTAHGTSRNMSLIFITIIPIIVAVTVAVCYWH